MFHPTWPGYEDWAHAWPNIASLAGSLSDHWEYGTPLRSEFERRAALVELDALVSVWLGITADQLVAIYKSRYPVLSDYEAGMNFDANGRKIARNHNTYGHGQTKETYPALLDHLDNPATTPPPEGYTAPFYKADRETEMRAAHAYFSARLDAEIAARPVDTDREGRRVGRRTGRTNRGWRGPCCRTGQCDAKATNAAHCSTSKLSTAPALFFESRTWVEPTAFATSTHSPPRHCCSCS